MCYCCLSIGEISKSALFCLPCFCKLSWSGQMSTLINLKFINLFFTKNIPKVWSNILRLHYWLWDNAVAFAVSPLKRELNQYFFSYLAFAKSANQDKCQIWLIWSSFIFSLNKHENDCLGLCIYLFNCQILSSVTFISNFSKATSSLKDDDAGVYYMRVHKCKVINTIKSTMVYTLHWISVWHKRYIPSELRPGLSDDDDEVELHCIVLQQIHANPPFPQVLLISFSLSSTNLSPQCRWKQWWGWASWWWRWRVIQRWRCHCWGPVSSVKW